MSIDPAALAASLSRLTEPDRAGTVVATLNEVAAACVDLFGVTGSGIMVVDEQQISRYVAATDGPGRILEQLESDLGQGPCTDALLRGSIVASQDLRCDSRWPELAAAIEGHGVRAVLGVPIKLGGITVGSLDVYRDHVHQWDESERTALGRYGAVIQSTLTASLAAQSAGELVQQLQYALDYRVIIERGVGYLMARDGVDETIAFNRLRRVARSTRRKIGDVAADLLATGSLPD